MNHTKRIVSSAAAVVLAAGFSVASVMPAQALSSEMADKLCAVGDEGKPTVDCKIFGTGTVQEGETIKVGIAGKPGTTVKLALFGRDADGRLEQVGGEQSVTVETDDGEQSVDFDVPDLEGRSGGAYHIGLADTPTDLKDPLHTAPQMASVTVLGKIPTLHKDFPPDGDRKEWVFETNSGIEGHEYKMQAKVGEKWVDFTTVDGEDSKRTDAEGASRFYAVAPDVPKGVYEARLYNVTTGTAGQVLGEFHFGVEPNDDGDDSGDDEGGNTGDGQDKGDDDARPSLPSTGV